MKIVHRLMLVSFENPTRVPGVMLHRFSHVVFIVRTHDQNSAAFIFQRPAHHDEPILHQPVNERRVLIPERLLASASAQITVGSSGREYQVNIAASLAVWMPVFADSSVITMSRCPFIGLTHVKRVAI